MCCGLQLCPSHRDRFPMHLYGTSCLEQRLRATKWKLETVPMTMQSDPTIPLVWLILRPDEKRATVDDNRLCLHVDVFLLVPDHIAFDDPESDVHVHVQHRCLALRDVDDVGRVARRWALAAPARRRTPTHHRGVYAWIFTDLAVTETALSPDMLLQQSAGRGPSSWRESRAKDTSTQKLQRLRRVVTRPQAPTLGCWPASAHGAATGGMGTQGEQRGGRLLQALSHGCSHGKGCAARIKTGLTEVLAPMAEGDLVTAVWHAEPIVTHRVPESGT
mmetsp:Transcript_55398/g.144504  ORF Transcript_55398/g.144504 Transcript_55398/m.144504 type:complete len:275 (-) Transcript_55398:1353-2177(-)